MLYFNYVCGYSRMTSRSHSDWRSKRVLLNHFKIRYFWINCYWNPSTLWYCLCLWLLHPIFQHCMLLLTIYTLVRVINVIIDKMIRVIIIPSHWKINPTFWRITRISSKLCLRVTVPFFNTINMFIVIITSIYSLYCNSAF